MDFDMDEEYNYTSKEIETEIDSDYYAYYIKEHAYILKNALDRIKKLEEENIQLKKKSEFISKTNGRLVYLDNESYYHYDKGTDKTFHIFGCPYCKELKGWAFCRPLERLDRYYDPIPYDVDILMLHDAPDILHGGVSTQLIPNRDFGNKILSGYLVDRQPKITLFGHIHTSPIKEFTRYINDCLMCNVSILDENYNIAYEPKIFIVD